MNIHEFQARELLAEHGVPLPPGGMCASAEDAGALAQQLLDSGETLLVLKAQIHAGGRGKGTFTDGYPGGVKLLRTAPEIRTAAAAMLGNTLVTKQTGPEGRRVNRVLVAGAPNIQKELYLAVLLDRSLARPVVMASTAGGMDIEEVAAKTPEKIVRQPVDPLLGLQPYEARDLAIALGFTGGLIHQAAGLLMAVYRAWWESDASLIEINPLCVVKTREGKEALLAVDAKISIDDNSLFRHPRIQAMRDLAEESPLEVEASSFALNYIKLDGNIACLVNGAGLAMATMDIIQHYGGVPANFLDVGGGASEEQVAGAFKIIMKDPNVKAILVNIFGGIMDCDVIARGIVQAVKETGLKLPLVVRLEGNNVESGRATLAASRLTITTGESMADAAQKVVRTVTAHP
ncbi:MAG: ADP-forming succinate--CoA ligase subunit beta [Verrucomicrobia bacterium]|jgi:succinyl-CoA synthetase beta subunit|nr:ADP-forming succinate--CoA ligase subunit beta [Verrucomicrobiota bacterium]